MTLIAANISRPSGRTLLGRLSPPNISYKNPVQAVPGAARIGQYPYWQGVNLTKKTGETRAALIFLDILVLVDTKTNQAGGTGASEGAERTNRRPISQPVKQKGSTTKNQEFGNNILKQKNVKLCQHGYPLR